MKPKISPGELRALMGGFFGTEHYWNYTSCEATDGVHAVAQAAEAGWLVTDIGAWTLGIERLRETSHHIVFWFLKVKDGQADLEAWDDIPGNLLFRHHYAITDFPEGEWKFYFQRGVLMLPDEY